MTRPASVAALSLAALVALTAIVTSCGADDGGREHTITVFAASSLTDAFTQIGDDFEAANPGVDVEFNFGSSSDLADSITSGDALGTAAVFASADEANMAELTEAGVTESDPVIFAENRAAIAVPAGNPGGVEGLDDFADDDLLIGLCAEDVPCGTYARQVLGNAGVEPSVDTNEAKVTDLADKLASGELDAGIVYLSDVAGHAGDLDGIEIPDEVNVVAGYPVAAITESGELDTARAFVSYLQSPAAQRVLQDTGFQVPR